MLQKIFLLFLFVSLVFWLTLNYGIGVSCDEVNQIFQWRQFCLRGIVAGGMLLIFSFIMNKKNIVSVIEFSIIAVCTMESLYSFLQLYGILPSFHGIFKVTGSFYNPGPLGGFIALSIPISLHKIFESKDNKFLRSVLLITLIINVIALPSTMSRTSWIAAVVSSVYVLYSDGKIVGLLSALRSHIKIRPRNLCFILTFCIIIVTCFLWYIKRESAEGRLLLWKISALAIPVSVILYSSLNLQDFNTKSQNIEKWGKMQILYRNRCYKDVVNRYSTIYDTMLWNPRFLYEYGYSLYKIQKYDSAISVLEQTARQSSDPMIFNIIGECHQALGHLETAETFFRKSVNRIPNRLYPHYLLYFLYCEMQNDSLRKKEYELINTMQIKIESPATRDLRQKVEEKELTYF